MLDGVGISKKVWHDLTIDQPNDLARTEGEQSKIMSDIFNWSSIAKFKPFQTTSPEGRHFQRHHGVLWFCLDAGSLMLISANTKSTFKKKLETGHQQAKLRAWRNSAKYRHSNQKSPDIFPVQWLTVCECCLPHLAINLRCPRLSNHGAAPRVAAPETAIHNASGNHWKPVALGDIWWYA